MFSIVLDRIAEKDLHKIPDHDRERILHDFEKLSQNPFLNKKLSGKLRDHYSFRIWPYRVIYCIYTKEKVVHIIRVGHRQGVYR